MHPSQLIALIAAVFGPGVYVSGCTGDLNSVPGAGGTGAANALSDAAVPATGLPCAVQALLRDNCISCHGDSPQRIAPMALLTRDDLVAPAKSDPSKTVGELAIQRLNATTNYMPPSGRMESDAIAPLSSWVAAGMPADTCDTGPGAADRPFEALAPDAALAKVKTFLTGNAPDENEYAAYRANEGALGGLIDGWLGSTQFNARLFDLLKVLFQQRTDGDDTGSYLRFNDNFNLGRIETKSQVAFRSYISQSFALTALNTVQQGRPFSEVVTTRAYMLNVPLMALLARMDARPADDLNKRQKGWLETEYPALTVSYTFDTPIAWTDSVNPASPNFGKIYVGAQPTGDLAQCKDALTKTYTGGGAIDQIWQAELLLPGNESCWSQAAPGEMFTAADKQFRPITVRLAKPGEKRTIFWNLDALRSAQELVLGVEYVGFEGSLGFLSYWTTNDSNEYRVTTNQALIVALGRTFTTDSTAVVADTSGVDEAHAAPGTVCYGCHRTLDPMRDFYRESYTYWGSQRTTYRNNEAVPANASFAIDGAPTVTGNGVAAFARALATHPSFAKAWVQKICGVANARPCAADDPEVSRLADVFAKSNYNFKTLLREVLSSPVVTYRKRTKTWNDTGATVGAALREDLCRRLENRLGIHDACATLGELDASQGLRNEIRGYSSSIPDITYARGDVEPQMPIEAAPFTVAAVERLCESIAGRFLGTGSNAVATPLFNATDRDGAIEAFLTKLMGVSSSDPRASDLRAVLNSHFDEVLAQKQTPNMALQSTFVLACTAPFTTSTGL